MAENVKKFIDKESISEQEFELISSITKIRVDSKTSQKKLEGLTGISQANIARFEKNTHSASLSTVIKILNALGYKLVLKKK
jgi:predicted transcriptional regulator